MRFSSKYDRFNDPDRSSSTISSISTSVDEETTTFTDSEMSAQYKRRNKFYNRVVGGVNSKNILNNFAGSMGSNGDQKYNIKEKTIAFVEKEGFILGNHERSPFQSLNHMVEVLLPYHISSIHSDDIKYRGSIVEINLDNPIRTVENKINNFISQQANHKPEHFTSELLFFYERRFFASKYNLVNTTSTTLAGRSSLTVPKQKKSLKTSFVKKRKNRKGLFLRFKKSKNCFVYGKHFSMHFKCQLLDENYTKYY